MIDYDTGRGIISSAMIITNTIIPPVLLKAEFYFLLGMNVSIVFARSSGYFHPGEYHVDLAMKLTHVTGALMTFFVVFYNGNVYSRYVKLYELTKGMCENCLYIVHIADKELKDLALVRKLTRLLLASCSMFFFFHSKTRDEHGSVVLISDAEWNELQKAGLLESQEVKYLQAHCKKLKEEAFPSFLVLQWSMKLYRTKQARINDLDKYYFAVRKCQEDATEMMELPMPFQYFHIMNLMLMLNLALWAYALAIQDSEFAPIIFLFVQLMFQGLRELSVALSDPFGDDATDFPINEWISQLYIKLHAIVETPYDILKLGLHQDFPLHKMKDGETIVDVLIDAHSKPLVIPPKKKTSLHAGSSSSSSASKSEGEDDAEGED